MKIKLILTAFAIAIASFSFGQSDQAMTSQDEIRQQATELTEQMTTYLELDETQKQRILGFNMSMLKKKVELEGMNLSEAEMNEKIQEYEERNSQTLEQVLSEEQYAKFKTKYSEIKMGKSKK